MLKKSILFAGLLVASCATGDRPPTTELLPIEPDAAPRPVDGGSRAEAGCDAGMKVCGGQCVSDSDPRFGCAPDTCTPCAGAEAGAENRVATCQASRCATACKSGAPTCATVFGATAGAGHTCAVDASGKVSCWGNNPDGCLGNPGGDSAVPVAVGSAGTAKAVAAGGNFSCALSAAGTAKCWGANASGQLGNGSMIPSSSAVSVASLSGAQDLVLGDAHACALGSAGVQCWGRGDYGQLGNNLARDSSLPVNVLGMETGVSAIALGGYHTCALTNAGAVVCWGLNDRGQLGDATTTARHLPVGVVGLESGVVAIGAGASHTCAVMSSGAVKCWGSNLYGELGNNTQAGTANATPVDVVSAGAPIKTVALGYGNTCALTSSGTVKCWGTNGHGELGNSLPAKSLVPSDVIGVSAVTKLIAGASHSCAMSDGGLFCWGYNLAGQLGDGTNADTSAPKQVGL